MQIMGAAFIGVLLDKNRIGTRRKRDFVSFAAVSVIVLAKWIGIAVWLYKNPLDPLNPFRGSFVLNLLFRDEFGHRKLNPPHFTRVLSLKSLHVMVSSARRQLSPTVR